MDPYRFCNQAYLDVAFLRVDGEDVGTFADQFVDDLSEVSSVLKWSKITLVRGAFCFLVLNLTRESCSLLSTLEGRNDNCVMNTCLATLQ